MSLLSRLAVLVLGSMVLSGSAAALTIARSEWVADLAAQGAPQACARAGCLQPVQMPMWPFGDRQRADAMPADQRELLTRLLSPELSEVVTPAERQILSQALDRGDRLSAQAVGELSAMLRDKQSRQAERLATARAEAERQRQQEQAAAEAERRRQSEQAAAAAGRQREQQAPTAAEAERRRQTEQAAAEAERQRQANLAAETERQRQAAAAAEAERRREAQVEAERERQAAEVARALAEAKREAEAAAAANAARLVFYDEYPPLAPL